jgi:FAD synthetase
VKTVLIFGTFDIVHPGHLSLFRQAKRLGGQLTVVVARDKTVLRVKGRAPVHTEQERKNLLLHIDYIDTAVLGDLSNVYKVIRRIRPDIIALGYDQRTFVKELKRELSRMLAPPRIVRLKPYRPWRHKTGRIRAAFDI